MEAGASAPLLLDRDARPDVADNEGVTPIDLAARPKAVMGHVIAPDLPLLCRSERERHSA